jgi:hypothetical protein
VVVAMMVALERPKYCYRVDEADRLVWVDSWWLAFARENGAADLTEAAVLGRSLWDYVTGDDTKRLYQDIHGRIRSSHQTIVLPCRCDSPTLDRHMQLTISLEPEGVLLYESLLLCVTPRPYLSVLDPLRPRSRAFLTMCSCCKRSLLEPYGWLDIEDVSVRLRLFEQQGIPELHYEVCPACAQATKHPSNHNGVA